MKKECYNLILPIWKGTTAFHPTTPTSLTNPSILLKQILLILKIVGGARAFILLQMISHAVGKHSRLYLHALHKIKKRKEGRNEKSFTQLNVTTI